MAKETKQRRRTASFSFSEDTIKKFETYCRKRMLNRSRVLENLIEELVKKDIQPKPQETHNVPTA